MNKPPYSQKLSLRGLFYRPWHLFVLLAAFLTNSLGPLPVAMADPSLSGTDEYNLPAPGIMVHLSPPLDPPMLKGIRVNPDNPFRFDFILDRGDNELSNDQLRDESNKLIKYFLASLTVPEGDLWVNLSPYEKERIIPNSFGLTEMGRDLLAEDYMLKQITASLIYPEDGVGKKFWKRIYEEAEKKFGTTNIPVNTFNKVWIVPDKAVVYENPQARTAYVVEAKLKVMLEQDYLSMAKHSNVGVIEGGETRGQDPNINVFGTQIIREIVIPELTKEVNEDKNFARLRQVFSSLILATWYKNKIKDSIMGQVYANKNKVGGIGYKGTDIGSIYQRYLQAFKKGAYNYIKDEIDPLTQEEIPRKYFSGGLNLAMTATGAVDIGSKLETIKDPSQIPSQGDSPNRSFVEIDAAMNVSAPAINNPTKGSLTTGLSAIDKLLKKVSEHKDGGVPLFTYGSIAERNNMINYFKSNFWTVPKKGGTQGGTDLVEITPGNLAKILSSQWQKENKGKVKAYLTSGNNMEFNDEEVVAIAKILKLPPDAIWHEAGKSVKTGKLIKAGVVAKAKEESLEFIDSMTGFPLRPRLAELVNQFVGTISHQSGLYAIMMIDVDNFGVLNNINGHPEGDAVLEEIADILRSELRNNDIVVRAGGEEIIVMMRFENPNDQEVLKNKINDILKKIREGVYKGRTALNSQEAILQNLSSALMPTIKKSELLAFSSIKDNPRSILNPNNSNGIWRSFSLNEVILKPRIKLNEAEIMKMKRGKEIWEMLKKAQGLTPSDKARIEDALKFQLLLQKENEGKLTRDSLTGQTAMTLINAVKRGELTLSKWLVTLSVGCFVLQVPSKLTAEQGKEMDQNWINAAWKKFYEEADNAEKLVKRNGRNGVNFVFANINKYLTHKTTAGNLTASRGSRAKDHAQIAQENGGIDLTPANMNLQTQNSSIGIKYHIDPALLEQLRNASGFVPVIINIQPLSSIRIFLGVKEPQATQAA